MACSWEDILFMYSYVTNKHQHHTPTVVVYFDKQPHGVWFARNHPVLPRIWGIQRRDFPQACPPLSLPNWKGGWMAYDSLAGV